MSEREQMLLDALEKIGETARVAVAVAGLVYRVNLQGRQERHTMSAGASRPVIFLWGIAPYVAWLLAGLGIGAAIHKDWIESIVLLVAAAIVAVVRWIWR